MKSFVGVKDTNWFAFLSQQQEIGEVNFLLKQSAIMTTGRGLDIPNQLHTSNKSMESKR